MMDIKYYKELHHNYMVIEQIADERDISFQKKMLETVTLKSILPVSSRIIDGNTYNYYDISSHIALKQLYVNRYLKMEDISILFEGMEKVGDELDKYLLDINRLVLDPEFIFYNYSRSEYIFMYNLSTRQNEIGTSIQTLLDYLLDHISPEDRSATDIIFDLYEYAEKNGYVLWDIIDWFKRNSETARSDCNENGNIENIWNEEISDVSIDDTNSYVYGKTYPEVVEKHECSETNNGGWKNIILISLGGIALLTCIVVRFVMNLEPDEYIILNAATGGSIILIAFGIYTYYKASVKNKKHTDEGNKAYTVENESENDTYIDSTLGLDYDRVPKMQEFVMRGNGKRSKKDDRANYSSAKADDGCTVLFEPNPDSVQYKLYAMDKKNKQHVLLDKYPFTIGKMTEFVDSCINHPSISRIHARIDMQEGKITIQDMNSTNGIFLNGIRLDPNETRILDVGDEIRLGSLNYCLRYSN